MKNTKSLLLLMSPLFLIAALLTGCDSKEVLERADFAFFIFRLEDESYKELIITNGDVVPNFPKRSKDGPYFGIGTGVYTQGVVDITPYYYDICELATEEKFLALHNNYYTFFPYTGISSFESSSDTVFVREGIWKDVCNIDPASLPILDNVSEMYSEIRFFEITSLEKITHKNRWKMTIDDMEKAVNKVIDEGELDKYSRIVYIMWPSRE